MCEYNSSKDMTKLEAYLLERPSYANVRKDAYAEWALEDLLFDIITELEKPPYYISGEEPVPIQEIIEAYIEKMRYFRRIASPGKKLMFNIAVKEAEGLITLFS